MIPFTSSTLYDWMNDFEAGRREPTRNNLAAMKAALETGGISFLETEKERGLVVPRQV